MRVFSDDRGSVLVSPLSRLRRLVLIGVCCLLTFAVLSGVTATPQADAQSSAWRINAGGSAYADPSGQAWSADTGFSGGSTYTNTAAIANTNAAPLYQSERYGNFNYNLSVPNGSYQVTLKFAELYFTTVGARVFNVAIEGQTVLTNFDIVAASGAKTAVDRAFTANVNDGVLTLAFTSIVNNAKINAIQVVPVSNTVRINAGGSAYTDPSGQAWSADTGFSGGSTYTNAAAIANTNTAPLYQSERYGNFNYNLSVPNGSYQVTLKFAELYFTTVGARVFNVAIEGQTVLTNFDIVAASGAKTAVDRAFTANVTDGVLTLAFTSIVNNAKVNAIQVVPASGAPAPTATPAPPPTQASYWGAYVNGSPWNMSAQDNFEAQVGKKASLIPYTLLWKNSGGAYVPFQTQLMESIRQRGAIPVVVWGASQTGLGKDNQPEFRSAVVASGTHDAYIRQFARDAKAWGKPFFLKLNPEMNGNWTWPWSDLNNGNQPGDFVRSWQHIRDIFTQEGATNATFAWCPNVQRYETTTMQQVFPGQNYVDWTCLHGYNWGYNPQGRWLSFTEVFSGYNYQPYNSYQTIVNLAPGKPVMLGEWATDEGDDGGSLKANWIQDAFDVQIKTNYPQVRAIVWYNINDGERWPVDSSSASLNQFKASIGSSFYTANKYANLWTSPIPAPTP